VGLQGRLGADTLLASGGEEREGWERILARSCMHRLGSPLLLLYFQNCEQLRAGVVLGVVLVNWLGIVARF
jgi:hypothetical protein